MIEADAPGKLLIAGEYAVLEGAPGIAIAIGVRAIARISRIAGSRCEFLLPDRRESWSFRWLAGAAPVWEGSSPGAYGLPLEALAGTLRDSGLWPRQAGLSGCRIELDSAAFHYCDSAGRRHKLGLGSSAAIVVALAGALATHVGTMPAQRDELLGLCVDAHRRLQGGSGSGVDVAAALAGGVLAARFVEAGSHPRLAPLVWPRGLHMVAVWSGRSASTPAMLGRLGQFRDQQPAISGRHMQRLGAIASRLVAAWQAGDVPALLAGLHGYDAALHHLDVDAGLGIDTPEHRSLRQIAEARGAVYKTSGAGGGDFGLAFTDDPAAVPALRAEFQEAGYLCLEAPIGAPGLKLRPDLPG